MTQKKESRKLVFKRNINADMGEATLTSHMFELLTAFDGKKTLGQVVDSVSIPIPQVREALTGLYRQKLIVELERRDVPILGRDVFMLVNTLLGEALGPMASVLIQDAVRKMEENIECFPEDRVEELLGELSANFFDEKEKGQFLKAIRQQVGLFVR